VRGCLSFLLDRAWVQQMKDIIIEENMKKSRSTTLNQSIALGVARREDDPSVSVYTTPDGIAEVAKWLNASASPHTPTMESESESVCSMLRRTIQNALLRTFGGGSDGDVDMIVALASNVESSRTALLTSELYIPPLRHFHVSSPSTTRGQSYEPQKKKPSQARLSAALVAHYAASISARVFRVPCDGMWRTTEIECVLCQTRFMIPHPPPLSAVGRKQRNKLKDKVDSDLESELGEEEEDGEKQHLRAACGASQCRKEAPAIFQQWCDALTTHLMAAHTRFSEPSRKGSGRVGGKKRLHSALEDCDEAAEVSTTSQLSRRRGVQRRDEDEDDNKNASSLALRSLKDTSPNEAFFMLPLFSLQHEVTRLAQKSEAGDSASSSHHRLIPQLSELVLREALLSSCSSHEWRRQTV
jgi:hypothetical protein